MDRAASEAFLVNPIGAYIGRQLPTDYGRLFFFSSRRRHTCFSRDWSSDVCSSDLHFRLQRVSRPRCPPPHSLPTERLNAMRGSGGSDIVIELNHSRYRVTPSWFASALPAVCSS